MYVKFGAIWELGQHLQSLLSSFSYQMLIVCLHGVQFFSHTYILLVQLLVVICDKWVFPFGPISLINCTVQRTPDNASLLQPAHTTVLHI